MTLTTFGLLAILINFIGFYFVYKVVVSYIKYGFFNLDPSILANRSYYICLFALCFLGTSLIQYIMTNSGWQLFYASIHGLSLIINYNYYLKYKNLQ
jgi:hypothetical protein